jgi:3-oxoacyl-[acyl-carrier protein] reductase
MKYALVTGGSRGIGRAIGLQLAVDLGYHILINYHSNKEAALETQRQLEELGKQGTLLQFDVTNREEVRAALDQFQRQNENAVIEVIVNNAGVVKDELFMWMKPQDWQKVMATSVDGFYNVTSQLTEKLILNRYGRIINIVSLSGLKGTSGQTNYSAAKGAVIAATRSLAQELAKKKITVNAVAPGFIDTDMTSDLDEKELKRFIPVQRFGTAEEVAHVVSFLASHKASYITGEVINVNGGIYS